MTTQELEQLRELLAKFSGATDSDAGWLRDEVSHVIHAIDGELEERGGW